MVIHLLSQLVDRAAARDESREAFRTPRERLTYGELARRSNRLAHLLVEDGVRPGDRVGIFMPRCLESAVAVYGIFKAGAAYVPIDPQMPLGGLAQVIADCRITHLTAHSGLFPVLRRLAARKTGLRAVVGLDVESGFEFGGALRAFGGADLEEHPDGSPPDLATTSGDLAYIMYSSGSTGRPKGIMHTHRSGLSYAKLSVETYGVVPDDRIGNHSPLHFDMSTFGYLSGPYAGATTLLVPEAYTKMAASLSQLMESERLTIWYSVPLALIQLLSRGVLEERDLQTLRWVLFGGEPLPRKHLEALRSLWPQARFSNVYGPAEVNQCTYFHVPPLAENKTGEDRGERAGGREGNGPIPIGRTWEDTEGLIVDDGDAAVADGEAGQLLIRSSTMMRGYWARPDLDARAFYRQPVHANYDRVFYRTGDMVRRREDGELMFLGRADRQVKVRGYRVELDELERTFTTHPDVEEAGVYPVRAGEEIDHLEASVTSKTGVAVDAEALRRFIAQLVSWYAVPQRIEVLEALPRTTSGKIDRRRLQSVAEEALATVGQS